MTKMYNIMGILSAEDFHRLVNKSNSIGQILLSHFLAHHIICHPAIIHESPNRNLDSLFVRFTGWENDLHSRLSPALKLLNDWPLSFIYKSLQQFLSDDWNKRLNYLIEESGTPVT
jgi:hypothetical protein